MRNFIFGMTICMISAPALAFECPVGRGAEIYDGVPGARLFAEPRDGAPVVARFDGVAAVAVLEITKECRLPKGWLRADHRNKSGYARASDLKPRVQFGMPE